MEITSVNNELIKSTAKLSQKKYRDEYGFDLYWDGACSEDKIKTYAPKGVKGFVLGTTVLFKQNRSYLESMQNVRNWIV